MTSTGLLQGKVPQENGCGDVSRARYPRADAFDLGDYDMHEDSRFHGAYRLQLLAGSLDNSQGDGTANRQLLASKDVHEGGDNICGVPCDRRDAARPWH